MKPSRRNRERAAKRLHKSVCGPPALSKYARKQMSPEAAQQMLEHAVHRSAPGGVRRP